MSSRRHRRWERYVPYRPLELRPVPSGHEGPATDAQLRRRADELRRMGYFPVGSASYELVTIPPFDCPLTANVYTDIFQYDLVSLGLDALYLNLDVHSTSGTAYTAAVRFVTSDGQWAHAASHPNRWIVFRGLDSTYALEEHLYITRQWQSDRDFAVLALGGSPVLTVQSMCGNTAVCTCSAFYRRSVVNQ